jgi:hypothetical protein
LFEARRCRKPACGALAVFSIEIQPPETSQPSQPLIAAG